MPTTGEADATDRAVLAGQSFDGVACNYGLTDLDDLDGLLATVARVLAVGGWWLVLERVAEPWPGADWQQRLPGAAPVPLYLVGRCLRR